jgi:hypothetical protein
LLGVQQALSQTVSGVSSAENTPLVFNSQAQFKKAVQIGILNDSQFTPDAAAGHPRDPEHSNVGNKRDDPSDRYNGSEGRSYEVLLR